jgi:lycopene beta-cyclase
LTRVLIAGGGLSGCLAAIALATRRPDVDVLLVEGAQELGGNHVWSFFDSDVSSSVQWVLGDVAVTHWPDHEVHFPRRSRVIALGYNSLASPDLDAAVRKRLAPEQLCLGRTIHEVAPDAIVLDGGERIPGDAVIDARGPGPTPGLALAWQKFVGRRYRFDAPHGRRRPVIMDATVDQEDGYRFVYMLPFTDTELLIEDTYYSTSPALDGATVGAELDAQRAKVAPGGAEILVEERGVLPVLLGGSVDCLWSDGSAVPKLGLRGGFFHPTTGYSLPDAVRNAALLAAQTDLSSAALHDLFHRRARELWKERRYFQLLNRMLFHGAEPQERYRVLEHFYRLPVSVIGRFYAAALTGGDKLRILSGRPPVPIARAVSALFRRAA